VNHERYIARNRLRRKRHARKRLRGTTERPRLSVFRSNSHIYCQVIDDSVGKVLAAASTVDKDLRKEVPRGDNKDAARVVGKTVAERALAAGIKQICFDRGHCKYHGRVAALADAAREAGLSF